MVGDGADSYDDWDAESCGLCYQQFGCFEKDLLPDVKAELYWRTKVLNPETGEKDKRSGRECGTCWDTRRRNYEGKTFHEIREENRDPEKKAIFDTLRRKRARKEDKFQKKADRKGVVTRSTACDDNYVEGTSTEITAYMAREYPHMTLPDVPAMVQFLVRTAKEKVVKVKGVYRVEVLDHSSTEFKFRRGTNEQIEDETYVTIMEDDLRKEFFDTALAEAPIQQPSQDDVGRNERPLKRLRQKTSAAEASAPAQLQYQGQVGGGDGDVADAPTVESAPPASVRSHVAAVSPAAARSDADVESLVDMLADHASERAASPPRRKKPAPLSLSHLSTASGPTTLVMSNGTRASGRDRAEGPPADQEACGVRCLGSGLRFSEVWYFRLRDFTPREEVGR